jgi:hypothetical protein
MGLATAVLGGFVGALIGLLIALVGQSREDERLRRTEEWRQMAAKQDRLRAEFVTALRLTYEVTAATGLLKWEPPSEAAKDPMYAKQTEALGALYAKTKEADIRLRLEGATQAWGAVAEVSHQHYLFRSALEVLAEQPERSAADRQDAREQIMKSAQSIAKIAETLHETLANALDSLTPPGPPPSASGLRSWLRAAGRWLRG